MATKHTKTVTTANHHTKAKKRAMLEALQKSLGIVTVAVRSLESDREKAENLRRYHYSWLKTDDTYRQEVDSIADIALDFAESKLHKQIEKEDTTATIFYLKTKGKKRGYIERQELTGADGAQLAAPKVIVLSPEAAKEIQELYDNAISPPKEEDESKRLTG